MSFEIDDAEAEALVRLFARLNGSGIEEAIVVAMTEAIERRRAEESPIDTAARIRGRYGVVLSDDARRPLAGSVMDEFWGET